MYYYNLTWIVSKGLERRERSLEHSSLGITHFLQPCASYNKANAHGLFWNVQTTAIRLCIFQVSFKDFNHL